MSMANDHSHLCIAKIAFRKKKTSSQEHTEFEEVVGTITKEFQRRGLVVVCSLKEPSDSASPECLYLSLQPTKRLLVKLRIENDFIVTKFRDGAEDANDELHQFTNLIAQKTVEVILRMKGDEAWGVTDAWVAKKKDHSNPSDGDHRFYRSDISTFMAFISSYINFLLLPAFVGVCLSVQLFLFGFRIAILSTIFFFVFMVVWGTLFMKSWNRQYAELTYKWGVYKLGENMTSLGDPKNNKNRFLTLLLTLCIMAVQISVMFFLNAVRAYVTQLFDPMSTLSYIPTILYSFVPIVFDLGFIPLAKFLTELDSNGSAKNTDVSFIAKLFGFKFVNRYCALFYAVFVERNLGNLQVLLMCLYLTDFVIDLIMSFVAVKIADNSLSHSVPSVEDCDELRHLKKEVSAQATEIMPLLMLNLVMQYGYISMFVIIFPIGPLLAVLFNYLKRELLKIRVSKSRKPPFQVISNVGALQTCFEFISYVSIATNCYLLTLVYPEYSILLSFVPEHFQQYLAPYLQSESGQLAVTMIIEHLLVMMKVLLTMVIPGVPSWVRKREALAKQRLTIKEAVNRRDRYKGVLPHVDSAVYSSKRELLASRHLEEQRIQQFLVKDCPAEEKDIKLFFDGSSKASVGEAHWEPYATQRTEAHTKPEELRNAIKRMMTADRNDAKLKIKQNLNTRFGFNCMNLTSLTWTPLLLFYTDWLPATVYMPIVALWCGYWQTKKSFEERRRAIGVLTDPGLGKFMRSTFPFRGSCNCSEKATWINFVLTMLFPQISFATEGLMMQIIQPILDDNQALARFGLKLNLTEFELGHIPPQINELQVYSSEQQRVVLQIHLVWEGEPIIEFVTNYGQEVSLKNLKINANIRVELHELNGNAYPCFRVLTVTIMDKPFIDFNLQALGVTDIENWNLVREVIAELLESTYQFPKQYAQKMDPDMSDEELAKYNEAPERGMLHITVERGTNLEAVNRFSNSSDPYVVLESNYKVLMQRSINCEENEMRTQVQENTCNPVWDEKFQVPVFDLETQKLFFNVLDFNNLGASKRLGKACLPIVEMTPNRMFTKTLTLSEAKRGAITVRFVYVPHLDNHDHPCTPGSSPYHRSSSSSSSLWEIFQSERRKTICKGDMIREGANLQLSGLRLKNLKFKPQVTTSLTNKEVQVIFSIRGNDKDPQSAKFSYSNKIHDYTAHDKSRLNFLLHDCDTHVMVVKIYCKYQSKVLRNEWRTLLGELEVPIQAMTPGQEVDQDYHVDGEVLPKDFTVGFMLRW